MHSNQSSSYPEPLESPAGSTGRGFFGHGGRPATYSRSSRGGGGGGGGGAGSSNRVAGRLPSRSPSPSQSSPRSGGIITPRSDDGFSDRSEASGSRRDESGSYSETSDTEASLGIGIDGSGRYHRPKREKKEQFNMLSLSDEEVLAIHGQVKRARDARRRERMGPVGGGAVAGHLGAAGGGGVGAAGGGGKAAAALGRSAGMRLPGRGRKNRDKHVLQKMAADRQRQQASMRRRASQGSSSSSRRKLRGYRTSSSSDGDDTDGFDADFFKDEDPAELVRRSQEAAVAAHSPQGRAGKKWPVAGEERSGGGGGGGGGGSASIAARGQEQQQQQQQQQSFAAAPAPPTKHQRKLMNKMRSMDEDDDDDDDVAVAAPATPVATPAPPAAFATNQKEAPDVATVALDVRPDFEEHQHNSGHYPPMRTASTDSARWRQEMDAKGYTYFYDEMSGESVWVRPVQKAPNFDPYSAGLPSHEEFVDEGGERCYHNVTTGVTLWAQDPKTNAYDASQWIEYVNNEGEMYHVNVVTGERTSEKQAAIYRTSSRPKESDDGDDSVALGGGSGGSFDEFTSEYDRPGVGGGGGGGGSGGGGDRADATITFAEDIPEAAIAQTYVAEAVGGGSGSGGGLGDGDLDGGGAAKKKGKGKVHKLKKMSKAAGSGMSSWAKRMIKRRPTTTKREGEDDTSMKTNGVVHESQIRIGMGV